MMHNAMYEVLARERVQAHEEQIRNAYLRRVAVLRRRQRRGDAARRALQSLQVR